MSLGDTKRLNWKELDYNNSIKETKIYFKVSNKSSHVIKKHLSYNRYSFDLLLPFIFDQSLTEPNVAFLSQMGKLRRILVFSIPSLAKKRGEMKTLKKYIKLLCQPQSY